MNKSSTHSNAPDENSADKNAGDDALDLLLDSAPEAKDAPIAQAETAELAKVAAPAPDLGEPSIVAELEEATRDLLMPSESDEPFRTVYWPLEKNDVTASEVALYLTENAEATVETQSVEEFFANAATVEDWMDGEEKASAQRFASLVETINAQLEKPRVYRIGEREVTAAVIGKIAGGFAGVVTLVVET